MSFDSKVIWNEGMFLNPQHFQQQERYFERYINGKCEAAGRYNWGVSEFEIDQELLKLGKLSVIRAQGVFPDGTPFSIPDMNEPPPVVELPENIQNQQVFLAVPVRRQGAVDVVEDEHSQSFARHESIEFQVRDVTREGGDSIKIDIAKLRFRLLLESEDVSSYNTIGVLRIIETKEDNSIQLDDEFIPTCVDVKASNRLNAYLTEIIGMLKIRADEISGRLADVRRGGTAEVADYLMLQYLNRVEPMMQHLASVKGVHPERLYGELVQLVGELATFVRNEKRPEIFPIYSHENLTKTFRPIVDIARAGLSTVSEQTAVSLPVVKTKSGILVSEVTDRTALDSNIYVISARADVAEEALRTHLPAQVKIGPVEIIRNLVNAAMPGIQLKPLPVAPRQIPYRAGYCYFELEKKNEFWPKMKQSGGFAIHVNRNFPGLEIEFWTIRP